ncbi:hypothetical protein [uncultured Sulfurimonas sp.]|jgi:hypothetical protein|uniref:hypothetical protein n=1 Tax=uncultured Sulfurimonas sp. TaxID=291845 RepID=UPI0032B1A5FF
MKTTLFKQLSLKIYDNAEVNQIMEYRGKLYIYINLECQKVQNPDLLNCDEFDGEYTLKWESLFNKKTPELVTKEQKSDLMDFLLNSNFDEEQAFNNLSENIEYEFNYLDKYTIPYHLKMYLIKNEVEVL